MPRQSSLDGIVQLVDAGLRAATSSPRRTSSPGPSLTMTSPWAGATSGSAGRVEAGGGGIAAARPQEEVGGVVAGVQVLIVAGALIFH
jgi:hypothetical protein